MQVSPEISNGALQADIQEMASAMGDTALLIAPNESVSAEVSDIKVQTNQHFWKRMVQPGS